MEGKRRDELGVAGLRRACVRACVGGHALGAWARSQVSSRVLYTAPVCLGWPGLGGRHRPGIAELCRVVDALRKNVTYLPTHPPTYAMYTCTPAPSRMYPPTYFTHVHTCVVTYVPTHVRTVHAYLPTKLRTAHAHLCRHELGVLLREVERIAEERHVKKPQPVAAVQGEAQACE